MIICYTLSIKRKNIFMNISKMSNLCKELFSGKKTFIPLFILLAAIFLSGCSTKKTAEPVKLTMNSATVIKSEDGGNTWNPKTRIDDKKTISGINVLSMTVNQIDPEVVYVGTESNGLFVTEDGGETWTQVNFADKVYNLNFDPHNPNILYGSGIANGRAQIYKRLQEGQDWEDIYSEPAGETIIYSFAVDKNNPQSMYAGTSSGVIIKSTDNGQTWTNLGKADGSVVNIVFDAGDSSHIFFGVFQKGILETKDGGVNIDNITKNINIVSNNSKINTLVADPNLPGVVYAGTDKGIFRREKDGTWNALNIIESSKNFPIRAIAINPKNSKEIIYSSAKAIYKSVDGGLRWSIFKLETSKEISVLRYDHTNTSKIYAGLRSF